MPPRTRTELENGPIVDQKLHRALALVDGRSDLFARQGSVVKSWRTVGGRRYGPYYRLAYREEGRQRSVYLGQAGPLVDEVRRRLTALQRPWRRNQAWDRLYRASFRALRQAKAQMNARLRGWGLRMKGAEVRGWRTSPMRTYFAQARSEFNAALRAMRAATNLPRLEPPKVPRLPSLEQLTPNYLPSLPSLPALP